MRSVRAVSDGDRKYVGFCPWGRRRINNEVFDWPDGRDMPLVKRNAEGLIVSGWVEVVGGEEHVETPKKKVKAKIPGLVDAGATPRVVNGSDLAPTKRASDRVIG